MNIISLSRRFIAACITTCVSLLLTSFEVRAQTLPQYPSMEAPSGMAAWWPGNSAPTEVIKGGHDAALINGATYAAGMAGQGFSFNGTNSYALVPSHPDLDVGSSGDGLTIEFWAKPTRSQDNQMLIAWSSGTTNGVRILQTYSQTGLWVYLTDTAGSDHLLRVDGGFFSIGSWTHVAVTYDRVSGIARVFHNGDMWIETNAGIFTPRTALPLTFGGQTGSNYFQGTLDEISFYTRPLSVTEIVSIYQAGAGGKALADDNLPPVVDAGPDVTVPGIDSAGVLNGSVTDDGKPYATLTARWSKVDGPGTVTFDNPVAASTTATFSSAGTYVLKLTGADGFDVPVEDTTTVRVGLSNAMPAIPTGMAAWWPANGNVHEIVKGGHDVELYSGTTFGPGQVSQAFVFDGVNDQARVAAHTDLDIGASTSGLTIEFWAKPTRSQDNQMLLAWGSATTNGVRILQTYSQTGLWVYLTDTTGADHLMRIDGGFFAIGSWTHLAITYDRVSGIARVFHNGDMWIETNLGIFTPRTALPMNFGSYYNTNYFQGSLDEISLYSRPLSTSEINLIFQAGTAGKGPLDDNQAPVVSAGPDVVLASTSGVASLLGTIVDDGKPLAAPTAVWRKVEGPGNVVFADGTKASTTATFDLEGSYVLELTGSDGFRTTADLVTVRVGLAGTFTTDAALAAWWPANGDVHEIVKGGHDLEFYSGTTFGPGKVSQAIVFDGANDQARVGAHADLDIGASTAGLTIEFWARPTRSQDNQMLVAWGSAATNGVRLMQHYSGNGLWVYLTDTTGTDHMLRVDGGFFAINAWTHVAVTYDRVSGIARVFHNGDMWIETNLGIFIPRTALPMTFGSYYNNNYFQGSLDEISLYSRSLSTSEINLIFQAGAVGKGPIDDNKAPIVSAGPDVVLPDASAAANLGGAIVDDGKPVGATTTVWSKVDGPGTVTFTDANSVVTTATFSTAGTYVLKLTGSDGFKTASDTTSVRVGLTGSTTAEAALAAWWPANGDVHEIVKGGHDLELYSGTTFGVGEVSQALLFDGVNDQARVAAHADLDIGASSTGLTIEFWARPTRSQDNQMLVAWGSAATNGVRLMQHYSGNGLWVYLTDTAGTDHMLRIDGGFFAIGAWTHVAVTYDRVSGRARVFHNGDMWIETNLGIFIPRTALPMTFGSYYNNNYFQGSLDEISLYSSPLEATEIARIYQAGAIGKAPIDDNQAPAVNAGPDVSISNLNDAAVLSGAVYDDGKPLGKATAVWSQVDGPGQATFADAKVASTTAIFDVAGTYVLKLTGSDGFKVSSDTTTVQVGLTSTVAMDPALAAWWPANGSVHEIVNGGHDMELFNGATFGPGKVSQALAFDGANDQARVAAHADLDIGASAAGLTIEFWAKPTRSQDNQMLLAWGSTTSNGVRLMQHYSGTGLWVYLTDTSNQDHMLRVDGGFFTTNAWAHVAVTYDRVNGIARLYRDGALITQSTLGVFTPRTGLPMSFGSYYNNNYFQGSLDEISLYTRPLSPAEVTAVYQAGAVGKSSAAANVLPSIIFTSPASGDSAAANTAVVLTAFATDMDGSVAKIEFFDESIKLGETLASQPGQPTHFSLTIPNGFATAGMHPLTARATDNHGGVAASGEVRLKVLAATPTIAMTAPVDASTVRSGETLALKVSATYSGGSISTVEFFDGQTRLGLVNHPDAGDATGYSLALPAGLALGTHVLKAKATSFDGAYAFSTPINVLVGSNVGPTLSDVLFNDAPVPTLIAGNGTFAVSAIDPDGVKHVTFTLDGQLLVDDTTPGDGFSAPFGLRSVPLGSHTLAVQAWDSFDAASTVLSATFTTALPPAPTAPTFLTATAVSSNQVSLTWQADLASGSLVEIERKDASAGTYIHLTDLFGFSYLDTAPQTSTAYTYRIRIRDAVDQTGDYSNEATATTLAAGFAPIPIGSLRLWLQADAGLLNGKVATWSDQSGRGNHATQPTSGYQPLVIQGAINGHPAVRFDGTNDYLSLGNVMNGASAGEIFTVLKARVTPTATARAPWSFGTSQGAAYPSGTHVFDDFGSTVQRDLGVPTQDLAGFHAFNASSQLNEWVSRVDGSLLLKANTNAVAFTATPFIGRAAGASPNFFDGDIAEILVFDYVLSASERQSVENYLYARYELALPSPVVTPDPGTFANPISVSLASPISAGEIYYTTDGTAPAKGSSQLYSAPFTISQSTTIRARVFSGSTSSAEVSGLYSIGQAAAPISGVSGLSGEYFEKADFEGSSTRRLDLMLNNPSFSTLPAAWQNVNVSTRWQGDIIAQFTEIHDFYFKSNGGLRVWFGGNLVIDDWIGSGSRERAFSASLVAGTHYPVRIEFQRKASPVELSMEWKGLSTSRTIVPQSQLNSGLDPVSGAALMPGLKGDYYATKDLSGQSVLTRYENVDFSWGGGSPDPVVPPDQFSVRWTGGVTPNVSGDYSFATTSDDGVRLWLGDQLIIDNWSIHGPTTNTSGTVALTAGTRYPLRLEYYDNGYGATIQLFWEVPASSNYQIIPFSVLSTSGGIFAATPTASPSAGVYASNVNVDLSAAAPVGSARCYYTLDGSHPTSASALYTTPIVLQQTTTLKARAYGPDVLPSGILISTYTLDNAPPTLSNLTYNGQVVPATITANGVIGITATDISGINRVEFTLDGQLLATDSIVADGFTAALNVNNVVDGSHTLTVKAWDMTGLPSEVYSATFNVALPAPAAPVITSPTQNSKTNQSSMIVRGTAEANSSIVLYNNGTQTATATTAADGTFSCPIVLVAGNNDLSATASNRNPQPSAMSAIVRAIYDNTVPAPPGSLSARSRAAGQIQIDWTPPLTGLASGYYVFRSSSPIAANASLVPANALNTALIGGTSYTDTPPSDGHYYYRVMTGYTVGQGVSVSTLSNQADAISDRVPPTGEVQLTPLGTIYDAAQNRFGRGLVQVTLTMSEALGTTPFLNVATSGGSTFYVNLTPQSSTSYVGQFAVDANTRSGSVSPVLSALDAAGNRGTTVTLAAAALVDTHAPEVSGLSFVNVSDTGEISDAPAIVAIKNEPIAPATTVTLHWRATFDEAPKSGSIPTFSATLSGHSGTTIPVTVTDAGDTDSRTWLVTLSLPTDAGTDTETLTLNFVASDDLDNSGSTFGPPHTFQVYKGTLPPLATPQGFTGTALPAGAVRLTWNLVDGAAAYVLQVKGPSDSDFADLQTLTATTATYTYTPAADGSYSYRVASVRLANGQDATSSWSSIGTVVSDRVPPAAPANFAVSVVPQGMKATWTAPGSNDVSGYSLYRSSSAVSSVSGLTPAVANIPKTATLAVDPQPVGTAPYYALVATDAAGNVSDPATAFANVALLPVATLNVSQTDAAVPVLSWTLASGSVIDGLALSIDGAPVQVNGQALMPVSQQSYADSNYVSGDRTYGIATVSGPSSQPRSILLQNVALTLANPEIKRGLMNTLNVAVQNNSPTALNNVSLNVRVANRDHAADNPITLAPGAQATVPVVVGGYDDLAVGSASVALSVTASPNAGETAKIVRTRTSPVTEGGLAPEILPGDFVRGGNGQVRFKLTNPSTQPIELKVARSQGTQPSDDITFKVIDAQGATLSTTAVLTALGDNVVALPDGTTVVRIPAGGTYTSPVVNLPIPSAASSAVTVLLQINSVYYHFSDPATRVMLKGPQVQLQVSTLDTSYNAQVTTITPETSNGASPIVISGRAMWRNVDPSSPTAGTPLMPVVVSIRNGGFVQQKNVTTDASGNFSYSYQPGASELGGVYEVWASHPDSLAAPATLATFTIRRVLVSPLVFNVKVPRNYRQTLPVQVTTGSGTALQNLRAELVGSQPSTLVYTADTVATLAQQSSILLPLSIMGVTVTDGSPSSGTLQFKVLSDDGSGGTFLWQTVTVNYDFTEATPILQATPTHLELGVQPGGTTSGSISFKNVGYAPLDGGKLSLVPSGTDPIPTWIRLQTPASFGSLNIGGTQIATIGAIAPADHILIDQIYSFYLRVTGTNTSPIDIPITITLSPNGVGSAVFKLVDPYFQLTFPDGSSNPAFDGVGGASVVLENETSTGVPTVTRSGTSDSLGEINFADLPVGRYKVRVSANRHDPYIGRITIQPSVIYSQQIQLVYTPVTFTWEVVPVTFTDVYNVTLTATFETNVPVPVLIVEPGVVNLPKMCAGQVYSGEFRITNHGLIDAEKVALPALAPDENLSYEFQVGFGDKVKAGQTVVVPYKITCLKPLDGACPGAVASTKDYRSGLFTARTNGLGFGNAGCVKYSKIENVLFEYHCINGLWYPGGSSTYITFAANYGDCPGGGTGTTPPTWISNGGPGWTPPPITPGTGVGGGSSSSSTSGAVNGCFPETPKCPPWMSDCECKKRLSQAGSAVDLTTRQYVDSVDDLVVPVPGGRIMLAREFSSYRWRFSLEDDLYALHSTSNDRYSLVLNGDEYLAPVGGTNTSNEIKSASLAPAGDYVLQGTGLQRITKNSDGTFTWTDSAGAVRNYNAAGKLMTITQSGGVIATFNYAEDGTLATVSDRDGRAVLTITYTNGVLTQEKDFTGRTVSFTYDAIGRLSTVTDVFGTVTTYAYDDGWELTGKREHVAGTANSEDHIETIEYHRYDSNNSAPPVRVVPGHSVFGTKKRGQVVSVSHNYGARQSYEFNHDDTKRTYYARIVTAGGREEEDVFDSVGTLISRSINGSSVYRLEQADRVRVTTEGSKITKEEFDERGNIIRRTNADGGVELYEYDPTVNLVSKYTDPLGVVTMRTYDSLRNELTTTEAVGTTLERTTTSEYYPGTTLLKQRTEPSGRVLAYTYDSSDRLTRVYNLSDPTRQTTYMYDAFGNRTSETDALGHVTTWKYDDQERLTEEINPLSESILYTYVGSRIVEKETGKTATARGVIVHFSYDSAGRKTKEIRIDPTGTEHVFKTFAYDADGHQISAANALGQTTSFGFDASGNQISISRPDADGNPSVATTSYDFLNRPTEVIDPAGSKRTTSYDLRDRPILITEAVGTAIERSTQTSYNLLGRITQIKQTDVREPARTYTTTYLYDSLGRRTGVGGDRAYVSTTVYDAGDRISSETDALGRITSYDYDTDGRPLTVRLNGITVATYTYDLVGNQISITDGVGNHRHFHFDALNRVTDESIPLSATQAAPTDWWTQPAFVLQATTYTSFGEVASQTRYTVGSGGTFAATTSASYDEFGRKTSDTDPAGLTRKYTYDDADYLLKVTYPPVASSGSSDSSNITYLRSPANSELVDAIVDRAGNTTHYTYDNAFHQTQETNSLSGVTIRAFDSLGRIASVTDPAGNTTSYEYDLFDQPVKITYPDHVAGTHERIETFRYDNHGKLVEKGGAGGYPLTYTYDDARNLTSQTDANGHTTRWSYTARNQVATKTYADSTSFAYTYDDAGRLKTRLDAMGRTTNYTFNAYGLPTLLDYPSDTDVTFAYDQQGRRLSMADSSGTTTWTYDVAGRPATETQSRSGRTLTFSYDNLSERTGLQVMGGASPWQTSYGYDNAGRLHTVLDDRLSAGQPYRYTYATNANLVTQIATPTGMKTTKSYDTSGRLVGISALNAQASAINAFAYTYDKAGQRDTETATERTRAFTYDAQRELTQSAATSSDPQLAITDTYTFDGIGNRLTSQISNSQLSNSTTYTTNSVNQYTALAGAAADSPVYDLNGNTTSLRGKVLRYDEENRLVEVSDLSRTVDYIYDGLGRRVERLDRPAGGSTTATRYVYDGWRVVEETDASGTTVRFYTRGLDLSGAFEGAGGIGGLLALTQNSNTASYFYDGNGNVTDLISDDGSIAAHYTYTPFGERLTAVGALVDINPYQFSSKERDLFTAFYYYGYRFYDPVTGRWLNRDPMGEVDCPNPQSFVSNAPTLTYDLNGLYSPAGHYYTTYIVAIAAGYSPSKAAELAYWSQYPDLDPRYDAMRARKNRNDVQKYLHSLTGGDAKKLRAYLDCLLKSGVFSDAEKGILIHALGDSFAHSFPTMRNVPGHQGGSVPDGGEAMNPPIIGHGTAGHMPDYIGSDPAKYANYVDDLYADLVAMNPGGVPNPEAIAELKSTANDLPKPGIKDFANSESQDNLEADRLRALAPKGGPSDYGDPSTQLPSLLGGKKLSPTQMKALMKKIKNGIDRCCPPK